MLHKKKNYLVFDLGGVVCHDVPYKFANVLFPPAFFKFLHQRESGKEVFEKFSSLAQSHMKKFRTNCVFSCEGDYWKQVFLETDAVITSIPFIDSFYQYLGPEYTSNKNSSIESKEDKLNMIISYMKKSIRKNYAVFVETMALLHVLRKTIQRKALKKEQDNLLKRAMELNEAPPLNASFGEEIFQEEEHESLETNGDNASEISINIINNLPTESFRTTNETEQQSSSISSIPTQEGASFPTSACSSTALHPSPKLSPSSPTCGVATTLSPMSTPADSPMPMGLTLPSKASASAPASPLQMLKEKIPFQCPFFDADAESKGKFRALKKAYKKRFQSLFEQFDFEEVGIISNHTKYWFYEMFEFFGLNKFFAQKELVVVSCDVGVAKPSDDIFRILKNRIFSHMIKGSDNLTEAEKTELPNQNFEDVVNLFFIDDTEENVRSAQRNGFIGIKYNALKENVDNLMDKLLLNLQKASGVTSTSSTSTSKQE